MVRTPAHVIAESRAAGPSGSAGPGHGPGHQTLLPSRVAPQLCQPSLPSLTQLVLLKAPWLPVMLGSSPMETTPGESLLSPNPTPTGVALPWSPLLVCRAECTELPIPGRGPLCTQELDWVGSEWPVGGWRQGEARGRPTGSGLRAQPSLSEREPSSQGLAAPSSAEAKLTLPEGEARCAMCVCEENKEEGPADPLPHLLLPTKKRLTAFPAFLSCSGPALTQAAGWARNNGRH